MCVSMCQCVMYVKCDLLYNAWGAWCVCVSVSVCGVSIWAVVCGWEGVSGCGCMSYCVRKECGFSVYMYLYMYMCICMCMCDVCVSSCVYECRFAYVRVRAHVV